MAHISLPEGVPGILGPLSRYPETGKALGALTEVLLRGPSTLTPGERELIAMHVSSRNECMFCSNSHAAAASELLSEGSSLVDQVLDDYRAAAVSDKMKSLLHIAGKVQQSGLDVTAEDFDEARRQGATDDELHLTVLIAAAFCMFNRYVDGLATWTPREPEIYGAIGKRLAAQGYAVETR
jgi:uncharacterized peroxidase-related enzyme